MNKGLKVNGSVNLNTISYKAFGIDQRRDPFNWFLTGSLNINLFGYSMPFAFSYSNANRNFSQPFNQFSFAPQYKWIKVYAGYHTMTFSSYTLAGHTFLGTGAELTPGKWKIGMMYGRLKKATSFDLTDSSQYTQACFKRMGYGLKVGYEDTGYALSMNIFYAEDDVHSLPFVLPETNLSPQQNLALGIGGRKQLKNNFFIEGEYSASSLNNDLRLNRSSADSAKATGEQNFLSRLLPPNPTNRYFDAFNASAGYQGKAYSLRLKYERIDPEYQTLGAYFFNNDLENITIAPNAQFISNKLNFGANVGVQRNNLSGERESTTRRFVGATTVTAAFNEHWNLNLNYSNFNTFTRQRPLTDPLFQNQLDTLNFYQVSETMAATLVHSKGPKERPQSLLLSGSFQRGSDKASYLPDKQQSGFTTIQASYSCSFIPGQFTVAVSGNYYSSQAAGVSTALWGPSLTLTKSFLQKTLRSTFVSSFNKASGSNEPTGPVLNNRLNVSFAPKTKGNSGGIRNNLSLSLNGLSRFEEGDQSAFTELTGTVNYSFLF